MLRLGLDHGTFFLEVGPGRTLETFAKQQLKRGAGHVAISCIRHPKKEVDDLAFLYEALGRVWAAGKTIDWAGFHRDIRRYRVPLPTYAFERQHFWLDPPAVGKHRLLAGPPVLPAQVETAAPVAPQRPVVGAPRNEIETMVVKLWQDALGIDRVAVTDNFYDLGGDSLLATTMTRRLRKDLKVAITPAIFSDKPTVAELVAHISEMRGDVELAPEPQVTEIAPVVDKTLPQVETATATEQRVAELWDEVLGQKTSGFDIPFLNAERVNRLNARLQERFGPIPVPVEDDMTVSEMATHLDVLTGLTEHCDFENDPRYEEIIL